MIFKNDELAAFLTTIRERFNVSPLRDWNGAAGILLRHDVDLDIHAAYELARLERDCGVRSSFFILTTSPTYNPLAPVNRARLVEMSRWGFEIGLHFDPLVYPGANENLHQHVLAEAELLQTITGEKVRSISLHNPSVHQQYPLFEGFLNAYDPRLFSPDCYMSDSCMKFRHDPYAFVERADSRTVQVLLHPLHYTADGAGYGDIMSSFVARQIELLETTFGVNATFQATVGHRLADHVSRHLGVRRDAA